MNPDRWKRIKDVAATAMELEGEERSAYLTRECQGDEDLRKHVQRLLEEHDQAGGFRVLLQQNPCSFPADRASGWKRVCLDGFQHRRHEDIC